MGQAQCPSASDTHTHTHTCTHARVLPLAHKGGDIVCKLLGVFHALVQRVKARRGRKVRALVDVEEVEGGVRRWERWV